MTTTFLDPSARILAADLRDRETKYGGIIRNVPRRKVSPHDRRPNLDRGGMQGGDRMNHHGYADFYAAELLPIIARKGLTIVELGILTGVGLAIWQETFAEPRRIIGLDVDLSHFKGNVARLRSLGCDEIEAHAFDELAAGNKHELRRILGVGRIDVMIDDALHDDDSIVHAFEDFYPFMAHEFLYFIEDNSTAWAKIASLYPTLRVRNQGRISVVSR